jgi:hypothetical protein
VGTTHISYSGGPSSLGPQTEYCERLFHDISQSLQANDGIVPQIRPRLFPSALFSAHYPLIILWFDTVKSELQRASLHKLRTQILSFCTLSISTCCYLKHCPVYIRKHKVSETAICRRLLQVKPIQLGPVDRASLYLWTPVPAQSRVYKPSTAQTICES